MISGIVVLYCPDAELLSRLLLSLRAQVDTIYVVDNTPNGGCAWTDAAWFAKLGVEVSYIALGDNFGIAKAQNVGVEAAMAAGAEHVIFFDQDSAPSEGMVAKLAAAERSLTARGVKVASVGPLFIDEKTKKYSKAIRHGALMTTKVSISPTDRDPVRADYIIASGSLMQIAVLKVIGLMQEELFIDWVDIEWGLRAMRLGYSNFIVPDAVMKHSIGDDTVSFGGRDINLHNDVRNYYIVRNASYLVFQKTMGWRWRLNVLFKIPQYILFYSATSMSKKRMKSFFLLVRACAAGLGGQLGKAF